MDFVIFSDSHGHTMGMEEAWRRQIRRPDAVIHLGDGTRNFPLPDMAGCATFSVRGNCDFFSFSTADTPPEEELLSFEGHRLLLTHGHRYGVKSGLGALLGSAVRAGADIVLFGHTHQPFFDTVPSGTMLGGIVTEHPVYVFNPGSIGCGGEGRSFGTLTLHGETVLFSHGKL